MTPERWKVVERIYQGALDSDPSARSVFLDQACGGDADLRREVVSLLEAYEPGDPFLESPALEIAARSLAAEGSPLAPRQRLGPYELIAPIGAGGMGEVWRALDPALNREVAIKVLLSQYSRDPERLKRFEQEARAAGMLNHPNVLAVYAIGKEADMVYIVTELLEGGTLRQRIVSGAILEPKAVEYAGQIAQGLAAAHDKGIVHRDLKPENVFLTRDGQIKILDFGLAKLLPPGPGGQAETLTASGTVVGTPAYMSPEQVRGHPTDVRSDIFALGVILYEMLSGRRPFSGETSVEAMNAVLKDDPAPIPQVSPVVEQMVRHCLEKEPEQRFQSARDLVFQLRLLLHSSAQNAIAPPPPKPHRIAKSVAILALVAAAASVTWRLNQRAQPNRTQNFTQLTFDSGLTTDPALSPDGKLLAYASDRGGDGNLDIWLQQVGKTEAIRLTNDPTDDHQPTFSPDGTRIAFRSERRAGGIYVISALGGAQTLIAPQGRTPRFSPDGSQIAYGAGSDASRIYVVASTGGASTHFQADFAVTRSPVWSADGKRILFLGSRHSRAAAADQWDWWVAPLGGGPAVKTGALPFLRKHGLPDPKARTLMPGTLLAPRDWTSDGRVIFAADSGDSRNIWGVPISPTTFGVTDSPQRLTSGASTDDLPSVSVGGRLAYSNLSANVDVWSLPLDHRNGIAAGELRRLTESTFLDIQPGISADGRRLVFASTRAGNFDVWAKDLGTGEETALTISPAFESRPAISADGSKVAFNDWTSGKPIIKVASLADHSGGAIATTVCEDDCFLAWAWSPENRYLLYWPMNRKQIGVLDVASRRKAITLKHPEYAVLRASFSPDGRWIAFDAIQEPGGPKLFIAPFQGLSPPDLNTWIPVTKGNMVDTTPQWSPDGNSLYFVSSRDGYHCLWRQPLDPGSKQPIGEAKEVYHLHGARRSILGLTPSHREIAVARDKLVFPMLERTGNVWMVEPW